MAEITHKGNKVHTIGNLPEVGSKAKDFSLTGTDLKDMNLSAFDGKKKVLNIYASLDTGICAASVRAFHKKLASRDDVVVLNISADLPFAFKRFCGLEGMENAVGFSTFRSDFPDVWGVRLIDGVMKGLCSRAVVVLDENNTVKYTEQVPEIAQEPDYEKAAAAL